MKLPTWSIDDLRIIGDVVFASLAAGTIRLLAMYSLQRLRSKLFEDRGLV
jgi:hypothetical protein